MLKGPRVTLRAIKPDDLPRFVTWLNDYEVRKHVSPFVPFTLEDEEEWYQAQRKDQSVFNLAIEIEDGTHIGSIGLMDINQRVQQAELGIMIGRKEAWSKGYGGEAIALMLAYGFDHLNLNRIFLRVNTDHLGAIKCYQRGGFVTEGELRQVGFRAGRFVNQYIMSVLRAEYLAEKNNHPETNG